MQKALEKLLINIADLFKVKTILSLSVIATLCALTIRGTVDIVAFMTIASAIVTNYFVNKDKEKKKEEQV